MTESHTVPEGAGRLDAWLAEAINKSRAEVARLIDAGLVLVDGERSARSHRPSPGQIVTVHNPVEVEPKYETPSFRVSYQDEHLAVVSKGPGVVVHPGAGTKGPTLVDAVSAMMTLAGGDADRPGVVHRLDRDTSGLLIFAKTEAAYTALTSAMEKRQVSRSYTALVAGSFDAATGRIEAPISRSSRDRKKMTVVAGGKPAATEFRVMEQIGPLSLIDVRLVTGRTHQIRVHFAHIGRPVVGDPAYGRSTLPTARRLGLKRQFLHAHRLSFEHPLTGEQVEVLDPLADDLESALSTARRDPK